MKQYDMILGESGGKESSLLQTFQKALDDAYNQGLSHAIAIADQHREFKRKYPNDSSEYNYTTLISRLEALKKPTV